MVTFWVWAMEAGLALWQQAQGNRRGVWGGHGGASGGSETRAWTQNQTDPNCWAWGKLLNLSEPQKGQELLASLSDTQ